MEEEKHRISMLVELVLFPRIRAIGEDSRITLQARQERKKQAIDVFVEECMNDYECSLSEEELRETVQFVLNRTINNLKKDESR